MALIDWTTGSNYARLLKTKRIREIQDYFDNLVQEKYNHFTAVKLYNGDYLLNLVFESGLKFVEANIYSIGFTVTVIDIYEITSKMQFDSLEVAIEQYIKEHLSDEIKYILKEANEPTQEQEENIFE